MDHSLKLVVVTDVHNGRNSLAKRGSETLARMDEVVDFVNKEHPDLIIDLGDRITDTDRDTDLVSLASLAEKFRALSVPTKHLLGNHDVVPMDSTDNAKCLGQEMRSSSIDLNGWHLHDGKLLL